MYLQDNKGKIEIPKGPGEAFVKPALFPPITVPADPRTVPKPDDWIERSAELVPLTGFHPFNAEPEMKALMSAGLITPSDLHYVRNHGDVPRLSWNEHTLEITGVDGVKALVFSMNDLRAMDMVDVVVTLSCDGNRRKELNMIKRSRGFNFAAGAISTSIWRGVRLADILARASVDFATAATHVCFEGAEELPFGKYETSIPLSWTLDRTRDIIIALEMNGKPLPPDHGFPIRLVCPGLAGARSVKWLKRIKVTLGESESWYHHHDNRLLPPYVDFSNYELGTWSQDPQYTVYCMNVNSIITTPSHDEWLEVATSIKSPFPFLCKGYAYSGGGKRVVRVEVSLDEGSTWSIATLTFPTSKPSSQSIASKSWTWCFWECKLSHIFLLRARSIVVRAFDESFNTQPERPTWNLLGLMNNSWYRIEILVPTSSTPSLVFRHPVLPGGQYGGYMRPSGPAERVRPSTLPLSEQAAAFAGKLFTLEEIQSHNTKNDCWVIIGGEVYDVTHYLKEHPGGATPLLLYSGGVDATSIFSQIHAEDAIEMKERFLIGQVYLPERAILVENRQRNCQISPRSWLKVRLTSKKQISPDSYLCFFELEDKSKPFGLAIGQHLLVGADIDGDFVVRPYTPIRPVTVEEDHKIHGVEILMKVYRPQDSIPGGKMGMYFERMKVGDFISIKGPTGHILYEGNGAFSIHEKTIDCEYLSLIAGGSGITPIIQLIRAILAHKETKPKIKLLYSNKTQYDILLRNELDELAKENPNQFEVWYTLTRTIPSELPDWKYSLGRISEELMIKYLFPPSISSAVFVCGPPAMVKSACFPALFNLGYDHGNMFEF